jgi:hypothetical protein
VLLLLLLLQGLLLVGGPVARAVFRQPEDIAHLVGIFCARLAPGIFPLVGTARWSL